MRALSTFALLIALLCPAVALAEGEKSDKTISGADAERFLAFYNELVDAVSRSKADCGALATAVGGVVDKNLPVLEMSWAARKAEKALPNDVRKSMDKRAKEMVTGLRPCLNDSGVKAAFERMKPPKGEKK